MKVIVTGAAGQIGAALTESAPGDWSCQGISRAQLDLADLHAITHYIARERPNLLINAAAYTNVDAAEHEEELATKINAKAVSAMAAALDQYGGRLVQISTDYVFGGAGEHPYLPDDHTDPQTAYGRSKLAGEHAAGDGAIILRMSWVYSSIGSNFVSTMLKKMREGAPLRVVNDQIGAPSWAKEVARVIWALARIGEPGIYHHRDAGRATWFEFACAIAEEAYALGLLDELPQIVPVDSSEYLTIASRPLFSLLDDGGTRELLGDQVPHWRENLRQMLRELC